MLSLRSRYDIYKVTMARKPNYQLVKETVEKVLQENFVVTPPVQIDEIIKNYDLQFFAAKFRKPHERVPGFLDSEAKAIYVNELEDEFNKAFIAAHELGHWLMHRKLIEKDPHAIPLFERKPLGAYTDSLE